MLSLILGLAIAAQTPTPPPPPPAVAPSAEALALGRRLADAGTLANILPIVARQETEALISQHPEFTDAERETLRQTGREVMTAGRARIINAMGTAYASQLSIADLRQLVGQQESQAARHQRDALPAVLATTMQTVGQLDFGRDLRAAFCRRTQKLCETPRP